MSVNTAEIAKKATTIMATFLQRFLLLTSKAGGYTYTASVL
jgi:hypothetical protein